MMTTFPADLCWILFEPVFLFFTFIRAAVAAVRALIMKTVKSNHGPCPFFVKTCQIYKRNKLMRFSIKSFPSRFIPKSVIVKNLEQITCKGLKREREQPPFPCVKVKSVLISDLQTPGGFKLSAN